jgi:hypothetical protein
LRGGSRAAGGHEYNQEQGAEQGKAFGEHGFFSSWFTMKKAATGRAAVGVPLYARTNINA